MKKLLPIVLMILSLALFAERVTLIENSNLFEHTTISENLTHINFTLDGYIAEEITEGNTKYTRISYPNVGDFAVPGKPDLPYFTRMYAIPNTGNVHLQINDISEEVISDIVVYPRKELLMDGEPVNNDFVIDSNYYSTGSVFPAKTVEVSEPAILRDYRVVTVSINPFRFDPIKQELRIIKNIDLDLICEGTDGENIKTVNHKPSRFFAPMYESAIENYDTLLERDEEFQQPCYLFIYPDNASVETYLDYLVEWKHQKGFEVHAASSAETGTTSTSVKAYIQDAYDTWENPPEFICLVGDASGTLSVPASGSGDHAYTQLAGGDILADAYIGRLSFSSVTEFQTILNKIFQYEKTPYMTDSGGIPDTDWYNEILLVGDPSSSGTSTKSTNIFIKETMQNYTDDYTYNEEYVSGFSSFMNTHIGSGVNFMNYRGYLGMSGWSPGGYTNGPKMTNAVIITCATGSFTSGTSTTETFLREGTPTVPKGAVTAIGTATTSTHTMFNNSVCMGIFHGIYNDGIYNMGGALVRGKLNLYNTYGSNSPTQTSNFSVWNNLMGDPGMVVWTGIPQDLVVAHNASVGLGSNFVEINVADNTRQPIENAWVTVLMGNDEIFATGYTDTAGNISLPLNSGITGEVTVTVTGHNYIPHIGTFDIISLNRVLSVNTVNVDDDTSGTSSGNNNSTENPGESIEFGINLQNTGSRSCTGVTAVLTTASDLVTITDDTESYGTINAGTSTYSTDDFDFTIDADVLGETEVLFNLAISDNIGNSWSDLVYITVKGSKLELDSYAAVGGNSILDPGETANVTATIGNIGTVNASAVYGTLSCSNGLLTINDATGYFGTIIASGSATNSTNTFNVTAGNLIAPGSVYEMELLLYNASGYNNIIFFDFVVGEATVTTPYGPDAYGYYAYDDEDTDYSYAPVYSWIEIDPNYGGSGTVIPLSDPGDTGDSEVINLPFGFRMYGDEYSQITVCSNGWIAPGATEDFSFMNWTIPGPGGPSPIIAAFWDDLKTSGGNVCYYYDPGQHIFIVEWSHMANDYANDEETFQAILYDPTHYPTFTGDSNILFQYKEINNTSQGNTDNYPLDHGQYCTIGLEDPSGLVGLQYTFNNSYPTPAKVLEDNMAILFTTDSPAPHLEPFVVLGTVTVNDSGGNGNADFGETVNLDILLNNMGIADATGVTSVLSSANPYVTITQNSSIYSNIIGGGSQTNNTDLVFTVSSNCPDGDSAAFQLDVTSNEDSWTLYFSITLNAPELAVQEAFVDDGDNFILDAGETSDIRVNIANNGGAPISNIQALLSSTDPYITINDGNESVASLGSGANTNIYFNVSAAAGTPVGHMFICTVDFTANLGYVAQDGFVLSSSIFEDNFETATGWILSGEFERGAPGGLGGTSYGNPDPTSAYNGSNVLGTDLTGLGSHSGDYESSMTDREYAAVSPAMNCTNFSDITLEFQRWLNVESSSYDNAYVDVFDGTGWNNVWANGSTSMEENSWSLQTIDISAHADGNSNVKIRFSIGSTDSGWEFSGWNIDDVIVSGNGKPIISVTPASVEKSVVPGGSDTDSFSIENYGGSTLDYTARIVYLDGFVTGGTEYTGLRRKHTSAYTIPFIKEVSETDSRDCTFSIELYDTYGDGWNGGSMNVLINGSVVLSNLTIATGSGPESHNFTVNTGDMISTNYTAGSWAYENEYVIYDNDGTQVASDGIGGVEPSGLGQFEGTCTNDPTLAWLKLNGEDTITGSVEVGTQAEVINLLFDTVADNLAEGIYNANIVVSSNDPNNSEVIIPVELTVETQANLTVPENVTIDQSGNNMVVSWSAVTGANSYKVYSDTDPYGSFSTLEVSGWGTTSWTTAISVVKKYYRVVASTDTSSRRRN
jgi:hypothetical protein